jgi:UDP-N-acetylglucosamine 2-epimerase (non-hydrolysing)
MSHVRASILCVVGTRPEAIKMAPVVRALQHAPWANVRLLLTGQHQDLPRPILDFFGLKPDDELPPQEPGTAPADALANLTVGLRVAIAARKPDVVVAQGDTTSVVAAALAAQSEGVPFAHVEAGLRTGDLRSPFPEELNRRVAARCAKWHFAPTPSAAYNLMSEGVAADAVSVVGNTVIDALLWTARHRVPIGVPLDDRKKLLLVTVHRRENFGEPLENVCRAMADLVAARDDVEVLWPVHPNPAVGPTVRRLLADVRGVHLCEPLEYGPFVSAMVRAQAILSDSGGVQEEAPALGKPVLVMRNVTERPEAVECGAARLVGTERERIVCEARRLFDDAAWYRAMSRPRSIFGDGRAAERIVAALARQFQVAPAPLAQVA